VLFARRYRPLLLIAGVDAIGTGLFLPVSALFFVRVTDLSIGAVGLGLSLAGFAGLAATLPAGSAVDRFGARRVLLWCYPASVIGYGGYAFAHSFLAFLPLVVLVRVAERGARPAVNGLTAQLALDEDRARLFGLMRALRNAGFGVGGLLATAALALGGDEPLLALSVGNAVSFTLATLPVARLTTGPQRGAAADEPLGYRLLLRDRRYLVLSAASVMPGLNRALMLVGVPLWLTTRTSAPAWLAGPLFTLNTVLVVALQVWASHGSDSLPGAARVFRKAAPPLLATGGLLALAAGPGAEVAALLMIAAVVALTVGEVWSAAGEWGLALGSAPPELRGRYLAVSALALAAEDAVGPALTTVAITAGKAGMVALAVVMAAGALAITPLARLRGDGRAWATQRA
jgi:Major Facilitator Superfamily